MCSPATCTLHIIRAAAEVEVDLTLTGSGPRGVRIPATGFRRRERAVLRVAAVGAAGRVAATYRVHGTRRHHTETGRRIPRHTLGQRPRCPDLSTTDYWARGRGRPPR